MKSQPRNGAYLDTLGWIRYQQQRWNEALDLLLRARACLPDDPTILDHVGDALAQLRRTPEAAAYWSRSYAVDHRQETVAAKLRGAGVAPASIPRIAPRPALPTAENDFSDEE